MTPIHDLDAVTQHEADQMQNLLHSIMRRLHVPAADRVPLDEEPTSAEYAFAKWILVGRRLRDEMFGEQLFGEPAWDMLLDLFINSERDRLVTVTNLSIASTAPATTALRWINQLTAAGLLVRRGDRNDARRVYVEFSPTGREMMRTYLRRMMGDNPIPPR